MLNWSMLELSRQAQVSVSTVKRVEHEERQPVSDGACLLIRRALEAAGVVFSDRDGHWIGLQFQPCRAAERRADEPALEDAALT